MVNQKRLARGICKAYRISNQDLSELLDISGQLHLVINVVLHDTLVFVAVN